MSVLLSIILECYSHTAVTLINTHTPPQYGLPYPPPGDLPNPGIELVSPVSHALAGGFFNAVTWENQIFIN